MATPGGLVTSNEAIARRLDRLLDHIRMMTVVSRYARIEAIVFDNEAAGLDGFTQEISRLTNDVQNDVGACARTSTKMFGLLGHVSHSQSDLDRDCREDLAGPGTESHQTFGVIRQRREQSSGFVQDLTGRAARIAEAAGLALVSLQSNASGRSTPRSWPCRSPAERRSPVLARRPTPRVMAGQGWRPTSRRGPGTRPHCHGRTACSSSLAGECGHPCAIPHNGMPEAEGWKSASRSLRLTHINAAFGDPATLNRSFVLKHGADDLGMDDAAVVAVVQALTSCDLDSLRSDTVPASSRPPRTIPKETRMAHSIDAVPFRERMGAGDNQPDLESEIVRQARTDLAACFRMAARNGLEEGICNHFSALVPGYDDLFLVNPYGYAFRELTASSLLVCDFHGNVVAGDGQPEATAFYIHARIHKRIPRAKVAFHTHMPYATALTMTEGDPLIFAGQTALKFYGRTAVDNDYNGLALDEREGDRIAGAIGDADIVFMKHHGVMVLGATIAEAWDDLYYLERACEVQTLALSTGRNVLPVDAAIAEAAYRQMRAGDAESGRLHLESVKRLLDRAEPDYRD